MNNPLGHRNHERNLGGGSIIEIRKGIQICVASYVSIYAYVYASVNYAYAPLTMQAHAAKQKIPHSPLLNIK